MPLTRSQDLPGRGRFAAPQAERTREGNAPPSYVHKFCGRHLPTLQQPLFVHAGVIGGTGYGVGVLVSGTGVSVGVGVGVRVGVAVGVRVGAAVHRREAPGPGATHTRPAQHS